MSSSLELTAGKSGDSQLSLPLLNIEAEFKMRLSRTHKHTKAYFGLRHSWTDGWMYMLGLKIAGVKIKLPVYVTGLEENNVG
jgi:hypothetical protein